MSPASDEPTVMCAIDDDGAKRRLIIANVDRDDAWIAMQLDDVERAATTS